jgi:hypothetical protein
MSNDKDSSLSSVQESIIYLLFLKDTYYVLKDTLLLREFYYFAVIKNPYLIIYKP